MLLKQFVVPQGLKKLQTEIAAFEKQKTEELERLEHFREEELRKLRYEFLTIPFVTVDIVQEINVNVRHLITWLLTLRKKIPIEVVTIKTTK